MFDCAEKVEALKVIFPDVEHALLNSACMQAMGDVNKAIDVILTKGDYLTFY